MVNENKIKEDAEVIKIFLKKKEGMTITDLERQTDLLRCQIRIAISFLLGSKIIKERRIGMAKLYTLK